MGTGWLIRPDIFVTAGHCSYDWSHKMGRAAEVKAYIGYDGRQSENDQSVQFRHVKRIVTTEGWVKTKGQKSFDVSFMQVDAPFTGITPIRFEETPAQGDHVLGVVGYPGDLKDEQTGEKGAHMYEMFLPTQYDLSTQADTMLEYQIDTYGGELPRQFLPFETFILTSIKGNSGSPVLRAHDLVSIGAHVYGGTINSASVIGKYGNPYQDYLAAFGLPLPNDALNLIPVTGNTAISAPVPSGYGSSIPTSMSVTGSAICEVCKSRKVEPRKNSHGQTLGPYQHQSNQLQRRNQHQRQTSTMTKLIEHRGSSQHRSLAVGNQRTEAEEEGFMDVLKTVASAIPTGLGLIGGGPIGALAGFALNTASKLAESGQAESTLDTPALTEGSMERAILAEATLSALQSSELHPELEESIFSDMKDSVMKALPVIRKSAPRIMGAMMEPALKIALDSLHNYNQKATSGAESFGATESEPFRPAVLYTSAIDQPGDHRAEAFLGHVQSALQQNLQESSIDSESEEGFFDIIKAGARFAGKGVLAAAKHGLPILVNALSGAEAYEDEPPSGPTSQLLAADALAQRALVAEAALQAVMKLPPQELQEEGFFDWVGKAVKTIAPVAMKVAPVIAGAIHPTVGKLVGGILGQESTFAEDSTHYGRSERPHLYAKRSLHSLRDASQSNNGRRSRLDHAGANGTHYGRTNRIGEYRGY